ncbi:G-protein coupled receptor Mth2-like isoform X11 [Diabrotica virgifera virgifera]|uniref:G-protein coupled receptor Mth2-like n=1 Tax=Diabrotica virgifera virgifera TaxID=50390 RepID=A0ABM5KWW0_DIAVI|nr:G-protein coupled receptor Mth2-like isoform X11 [Diabrotica virgifera virgifera]
MDTYISLSLLIIYSVCSCAQDPCSKYKKYLSVTTFATSNSVEDYEILKCICKTKVCIRKCCFDDMTRNSEALGCGEPDLEPSFNIFNGTVLKLSPELSQYNIISGYLKCPEDPITLSPQEYPEEEYSIQKDGSLFVPSLNYSNYSVHSYCLLSNGAQVCQKTDKILQKDLDEVRYMRNIQVIGMIISMPFLLLTFLVYLLLPERNLHRRALMSYVFTLLAAYITLVTIQLYSGQFPDTTCHVLGYLIIFFFLVSFFWMNVMCVDMWLAFSGMRTFLSKKTAERKRFIIYCIYAWGMPIVHVLIVFLINHYGSTDTSWNPQIGVKRCFLGEGMPTFYYFYLPMAILIGINITLFVLTTVRIQKIKKETSMLKQTDSRRHTYEDDKQKFNLYLKLMFAMGVNWITELVSWAVDYAFSETPAYVWYITDFTNAMYGVLIFLIFVFKKKIWRSLKKKYYICIGKPHLAHSMTTSSARGTRTSNYSTTDTTAVSTDYRLSDMKNGKIPEESALNRT